MKIVILERAIKGNDMVARLQSIINKDPSRIVSIDGITILGVIIHEE